MSLRLRFSNQSDAELDAIWNFIAADNVGAAEATIKRIVTSCWNLAATPELGRRRDEIRPGLRSFPVGRYVILYRVRPETLTIVQILHGARNLEELLASPTPEEF